MKNSMKDPQKIKNRTTIWSNNPTFGNISRGNKNTNSKRHLHPHVHSSIVYNSQDMETTQVSTDGWMDKEVVREREIYIYLIPLYIIFYIILYIMDYYSIIKKMRNPTIWDNMDGPWRHYTKWNKLDRERQIVDDFSHMWNLKTFFL